jgi:copper(I)-binding protein
VNRALRAATMGVLLLCPTVISACSAGQVTQTASQVRDKVGAMAEVGDLTLRAVEFAHPRGGSYDDGDDADLTMVLANSGRQDDALVGIDGEGFGEVEFDTGGAGDGSELEIPAGEIVYVDGDDLGITLNDLDEPLTTGQTMDLTFSFENAGEVTLPVTVSTPDEALEREEGIDFHHEEEGGAESEEEREGESREGGE